jgi:hypothetical protein
LEHTIIPGQLTFPNWQKAFTGTVERHCQNCGVVCLVSEREISQLEGQDHALVLCSPCHLAHMRQQRMELAYVEIHRYDEE